MSDEPTLSYTVERWTAAGACRGMDAESFFPIRGESTRAAKQVCSECPVTDECLDYALRTSQRYGIWGGKSEQERRRLRAVRNKRGPAVAMDRYRRAAEIAVAAHKAGQIPSRAVSDALGVTAESALNMLCRARDLGIEIPPLHTGGSGSRLKA
jgi:hypothetical protein